MFEDFLDNRHSWINQEEPYLGVIFSSRLRLARNLDGFLFPAKLKGPALEELIGRVKKINLLPQGKEKFLFFKTSNLSSHDKNFLLERHLVSQNFLLQKEAALIVSSDENIALMVNEEDHLRLQVVEPGYNLEKGWAKLSQIDDNLGNVFNYAFSPKFGYLSACPTNAGTALRASCMLCLPGLILTKKIEKVLTFLTKLSFTARGLFGEGSQALGNFFQISNQVSLGVSEVEIIDNLAKAVIQVSRHELNARQFLLEKFKTNLEDTVWRALGIMRNSRLIKCREALNHLSFLFLGIDLGIIKGIKKQAVSSLFAAVQPAHLEKLEGKPLNQNQRDYLRASLLREKLKD